MPGYAFTDGVRELLAAAREEASRWNHEQVGTEHILLAYTLPENVAATALLSRVGAPPQDLRVIMDQVVRRGVAKGPVRDHLPYTNRAKKTLELAMREARDLGHDFVGIHHLLLGVLREERGIGAQVLADQGVSPESVRAALLEQHPVASPTINPQTGLRKHDASVRSIRIHPALLLSASALWVALWAWIRRDTLGPATLGTLAIILGPLFLLWLVARRR